MLKCLGWAGVRTSAGRRLLYGLSAVLRERKQRRGSGGEEAEERKQRRTKEEEEVGGKSYNLHTDGGERSIEILRRLYYGFPIVSEESIV